MVQYDKMCKRLLDDRSDKFTYMNADIDDDHPEGQPVWMPG